MNSERSASAADAGDEISALIDTLVSTGRRLEEITSGEVDTVADRDGTTFLLRHAQERLRDSEVVKQAAILNALPAHIALVDANGSITSVNEAWRLFGDANALHASGHALGLNYLTVCDRAKGNYSSEARQVAAGIRAVLSGQEKSFSIEYPCDSSTEQRWFQLTVTPLAKNQTNGAVVMHLDISARHRAAEALRELSEKTERQERILNSALASMSDFAQIYDRDGRLLFVNQPLLNLWGLTLDEVIGKDFHELGYPDELSGKLQRQIAEVFETQRSITDETPYVNPAGLEGFYEYIFSPVFAADRTVDFVVGSSRDVTARKRAEGVLREREERLRAALSASGTGTFRWDIRTNKLSWDRSLEALFGLPAGRTIDSLEKFVASLHPDDRAEVIERCERCAREGADFSMEFRVLRPDGGLCWVYDTGKTFFDGAGQPLYMTGACVDITERKLAETALRASETEFRALAEAMPQMVWITRPDGWNTYFSQQWMDYTGLTLEESLGGGWNKPFHPDDQQRAADAWQHATTTAGVYSIEARLRRADGDYRWWLIRGVPQQDDSGKILKWFGTCTDIHDLKLAELKISTANLALRESNEKFHQLADNISEVFWITSPDLKTMHYISAAYGPIWGRTEASLYANPHQWIEAIVEEDRELAVGIFSGLMGDEPKVDVEYRIARPDGTIRWIHDRGFQVRDAAGTVVRLTGIASDITARKAAQKQLREADEKYRSIFDNASEGIFQNTPEGVVLSANPALARMLGFASPEELIRERNDIRTQTYVDPARRPELQRLLEENGVVENFEYEVKRKDGSTIFVSENIRLVRDAAGKTLYYEGTMQDITERRRAQAASILLTAIVESSNDAIIGKDLNSIITSWNKGAEKIFGYTAGEMIGTSIMRLIPTDRDEEENYILGTIKGGESLEHFETVRQTKGGELIDISVTASPIKDVAGRIIGVSKMARDITEEKRAQQALRESEEKFRQVTENIADVFYMISPDMQQTHYVSPAYELIWGRSSADLYAHPQQWADAILTEDRERVWKTFSRLATDESSVSAEFRIARPNGDVRWILSRGFQVRDKTGKVIRITGVARDITERREAEHKVSEQANLLNLAQDAIMVRDMNDRIEFWNHGAELLYGWTAEEARGQLSVEFLHYEENVKILAERILLETGEWSGDCRHLTKAGNTVIVRSRWTLVRDEHGQPKSKLIIATDMTEQKKVEEQFLRAQRLESIGTLASGVAHDLNNILVPIMMAAPVLRGEMDPAEREKFLDIVETSAHRGADVIKQMLTFARGADGDRILLQPIYLLEEVSKIARQTFPKSIVVRTAYKDDIRSLEGDATQLHQVLLNLCINARDAMPDGGELRLSVENFDVDEHYASVTPGATAGPHVMLQVTDNGSGIPKDVIAKIYDPFFTTKSVGHGTGLGLSTVAGIVKSHGGFMHVYSQPGQTTFNVFLPAKATVGVSGVPGTETPVPPGHGETILMVDDEPTIREVAEIILTNHGYKVLLAEDGVSAVAIFARQSAHVDVVVTDLAMPGMSGLMLVQTLRQIEPRLKVILSTGGADDTESAEITGLAVDGFLIKPYAGRKLLLKLDEVLHRSLHRAA